ncbi:hypothetical protein [Deinococcus hopiensis]|uniref:hypothetical protein n=1 Tax=Deinococcus hopiensis TaxID=309885 RepID=UPI000A05F731|nr:hypothetical protein [Deinococcus hopiensis]
MQNTSGQTDWVFNPYGTRVDRVETHAYRTDAEVLRLTTGCRAEHEYTPHYGQDLWSGFRTIRSISSCLLQRFHASPSPFFLLALRRSVARRTGLAHDFITDEPES